MTISILLKLYGVAVATFFAIDLLWLGVVARPFYLTHLGHLMRTNVNWVAAIIFYLVFVIGIIVDDAIIISENIYRLQENAGSRAAQPDSRAGFWCALRFGDLRRLRSDQPRNP